ncbi:MAG: hypothetical protein M1136_02450 [Chloroflexi bacterium]|nr:hypothetical protein [Chloroflexota bacterium]
MRRALLAEKGETIAEVLVALAFVAIIILPLLNAMSGSALATRLSDEKAIAANIARSQIEYIKNQTYNSTPTAYSLVATPPDYAVDITTSTTVSTDLQKIVVRVSHYGKVILTLEDYKVNRQ